jgi:mRNA-degrading endonuclease RelE of RelBE toxin-antitoxin system
MYKIILEKKAEKSFSQLDQVKRKKVINAIDDLESKGLD